MNLFLILSFILPWLPLVANTLFCTDIHTHVEMYKSGVIILSTLCSNHHRLYESQLVKSRYMSTQLGVGVALLQALSHLAINGMVLLVVGHGGLLLATNQISPGSLMAFLVATQTIQRYTSIYKSAVILLQPAQPSVVLVQCVFP